MAVLTRGIYAFQSGDRNTSYRMMRYRVLFQSGVALLVLFGVLFRPEKPDPSLKTHYTVDKDAFLRLAKEVSVDPDAVARAANVAGATKRAEVARLRAEYGERS